MDLDEFRLQTADKLSLYARCYRPEENKRAVLIIVHGMAEHSLRYEFFAETICSKDRFVVYTYDQRGHGKTAGSTDNLGFFAKKDGWQKATDDLKLIVNTAKKEYPNLPIFLFGHSMGSFICRNFISQTGGSVKGVILSGTAGSAGLLGKAGILLTKILSFFKAKDSPSPLMDKLTFGDFNKAFKPNRTKFDWLSRDEKEVDKYINDPYCGTIFTLGFFKDMLTGLEAANTRKHAEKFPKNLNLHLLAGNNDPVSKNGKQIQEVFDLYNNVGLSPTMKLYPGGRHEMLNETNRDEVVKDIRKKLNSWLG